MNTGDTSTGKCEDITAELDLSPEDNSQGTELENARVGRSTLIMAVATTLSRVTGFIRAWALAFAFGTTVIASTYTVANDMTTMIFELVTGGILSSLFIPTFIRIKKERGDEAAWRFAGNLMTIVTIALGSIAVFGMVFPEYIMRTQYFLQGSYGNTEELLARASFFFRFFAIQVVFYGVGMIIQAMLNAQRKFLWVSLGPVFNNLVIIGFLLYAAFAPTNETTLTILALGTSLAAFIMFAVMVPSLRKTGFKLYLGVNLRCPDLRAMIKLALPMVFYVICNLVAVSMRNATAATTGIDGQAIVRFAAVWQTLPYGIIAVSVATALFTEMSRAANNEDMTEFKTALVQGLRTTALLMLPASALLFGLAQPLISLYVGGEMSAYNAEPIISVLQVWAISLVFFACMMYLLRSFFSLHDTKTPAFANFACTIVQVSGYLILTGAIVQGSMLGIIGIPFADGIFYLLLFVTLLALMRRKIGSFDIRQFMIVLAKMSAIAIFVGALTMYSAQALADIWGQGYIASLSIVALCGILGLALSALGAHLLRIEEMDRLSASIRRRLSRKTS